LDSTSQSFQTIGFASLFWEFFQTEKGVIDGRLASSPPWPSGWNQFFGDFFFFSFFSFPFLPFSSLSLFLSSS
jgi:hypothetical protein